MWTLAISVCVIAPIASVPIVSAYAETTRADIAAPIGTLVETLHAVGAQIYECRADTHGNLVWTFREPIATLMVGERTVGRHFEGPSWQMADGSLITGKLSAQAAAPLAGDLPWLRLQVSGRQGSGELDGVAIVQRLATHGGVRSGPCPLAGAFEAEPYSADYLFSRP